MNLVNHINNKTVNGRKDITLFDLGTERGVPWVNSTRKQHGEPQHFKEKQYTPELEEKGAPESSLIF